MDGSDAVKKDLQKILRTILQFKARFKTTDLPHLNTTRQELIKIPLKWHILTADKSLYTIADKCVSLLDMARESILARRKWAIIQDQFNKVECLVLQLISTIDDFFKPQVDESRAEFIKLKIVKDRLLHNVTSGVVRVPVLIMFEDYYLPNDDIPKFKSLYGMNFRKIEGYNILDNAYLIGFHTSLIPENREDLEDIPNLRYLVKKVDEHTKIQHSVACLIPQFVRNYEYYLLLPTNVCMKYNVLEWGFPS